MKILLPGDQFSASNSTKFMLIPNIFDIALKKIKNNVLESGYSTFHKKLLTIGGEQGLMSF